MAKKTDIGLLNFFVFNSKYGPREGEEHKKILYYYPPAADLDTQIKNVGLCEAVIKFTNTFSVKSCNSLHTQKSRQLFYNPQTEYWLVMTLSIPHSQKTKDGQTGTEYHEDDVQDTVYEAVVQQAYKMFKLFNGTMQYIVDKTDLSGLRQRLDHFFSKYLLTLKLNQSDILDVCNGIHFLPLDKNTYLRIQCFINLLEATFKHIKYTAFLYNEQLVWSGLEQDDMRILYNYLTTSLFPAFMEQEFQTTSPSIALPQAKHYGKYMLGPPNINDDRNPGRVPSVHISAESGADHQCHLVVYRALSATVCLLIDGSHLLTFDYLKRMDRFLGPQLSCLASDIGDQYNKKPPSSGEVPFKYVYFNHMNLAQKTTVHSDSRKLSNVIVPPDVLRILADLNHDLSSVTSAEDGETIVKMYSDYWVVSKKSDQREFYVILNQKNANLIEINEEVKRLCATHFSNIFFLD